ncbi:protein ABHD11-like [Uloborus diversus]|uniref:protein ABHD11-like n=1 Tax=Uloborus diversus TaxID=327109 RepID=UPI00240A649C|nr:protein ABHD11-like [Uloborus diversus]
MASYTPIKLAHYIAEPENGTDAQLSPIIFLHGLTATKEIWEKIPQIVASKTKRRAYVVDQRNHGDTEWTDLFNFDILTDDLLHFMDEKGIEKAVLIGHSMGGVVALKAALKHPEKVEALIVEDMIVGKLPNDRLKFLKSMLHKSREFVQKIPIEVDESQAVSLYRDFLQEIAKTASENIKRQIKKRDTGPDYLRLRRDENGRWDFKSNYIGIIKALSDPDNLVSDPEGTYNGPACFIYGTLSHLPIPANEPQIKKHFPNAELVPIEGATHHITADCPEELTKAFLEFISSIS